MYIVLYNVLSIVLSIVRTRRVIFSKTTKHERIEFVSRCNFSDLLLSHRHCLDVVQMDEKRWKHPLPTPNPLLRCPMCGKKFCGKWQLVDHIKKTCKECYISKPCKKKGCPCGSNFFGPFWTHTIRSVLWNLCGMYHSLKEHNWLRRGRATPQRATYGGVGQTCGRSS